ncbi:MAG: topoisomerase protein [Candidatus Jorgensenbacteria bacterium GW2011_GWA1_48_11]|uniref:DNA topoisomerase 1 n=1 Tax=Candidatus Jorgensenbacteria bacterium GW2011_GWA1_48_11 TaxID=1618660 RepID=A0A0G1U9N9_9BACT|nr:MAG: topoisomerase protein [Candidatus Jorgensenbacteria bacterium GW2011_GWA1_48_11]KKW12389.1 MAG: topoisomerase protein [Candidatus Jorgensenbacteria bacterium GW2011_GWB1_49_9]
MKLIIVESPTKAKTIANFVDDSFKIEASVGHIRDLPKSNKAAIDIPAGFVPRYEIVKGKEKLVGEIKNLAKKADAVYLATDPDREGEAIAWHIEEACGIKDPKRIVFHEITEQAVKDALAHPRQIDENLLKAQEARRVLDRLFGYDLSGLIWKKVRYGLSAGRVQSPALRILMEREREIQAFHPETYWTIAGTFLTKNKETLLLTCEKEPRDKEEMEKILTIARQQAWQVIGVKQTNVKRSPRAPFITSTLQQVASSRLGFSPSRTMSIAQRLYEQGLITYMRTDSTHLAQEARKAINAEILKTFGKEYLEPRNFITKSKTAQEAHEAIRPTVIGRQSAGGNEEQKKLYALIRERTLASQMADARLLRTTVTANVGKESLPDFTATGSIVEFPGWLAADPRSRGEENELPRVAEKEPLSLKNIESQEKQTEPPSRYTEAGLVKELEKREIGRPSTYATIILTLLKRGYVEKLGKALKPTDTGDVVSSFLEKYFGEYVSDTFTAEMETDLDQIAEGRRDYVKTMKEFYTPFSKDVKAKDKLEKVTTLGEDPRFDCPLDPAHGHILIKLGRTGKFLSCRKFPDCLGARKIDGSVMEPPKEIGEACPDCKTGQLVEREGRFGKFIACSNYPKCKYIRQSENNLKTTGVKCPLDNGEIAERHGRFGPFFSCANYPKCKFIMRSRPTGNVCPLCKSLMMEGTKTIPERCSNKNCINYNPHKLK